MNKLLLLIASVAYACNVSAALIDPRELIKKANELGQQAHQLENRYDGKNEKELEDAIYSLQTQGGELVKKCVEQQEQAHYIQQMIIATTLHDKSAYTSLMAYNSELLKLAQKEHREDDEPKMKELHQKINAVHVSKNGVALHTIILDAKSIDITVGEYMTASVAIAAYLQEVRRAKLSHDAAMQQAQE